MNWYDDDLRQQSAQDGGMIYTVYLVAGRQKWTVARVRPAGVIEWSGEYFDGREEAKTKAPTLTYTGASIPSPELNEAVVRVKEKAEGL